jgi:hypothetical protein
MINRSLVSFILLLAIQTMAGAEMYRCELADGSVIYGDRRVNLSDDCQPVTADSAKGYLSVQQEPPDRSATDQPVVAKPADQREVENAIPQDLWAARATALVENYNDARKRRIRESYLVNKRKAMREMVSLNAEKKAMLAELQESSLSQEEREKIRGILAEIPEDAP